MTDGADRWASVADYDQHHAAAIDLLRAAPVFLLAAPTPDDDGGWRIVVTGGGDGFDTFFPGVVASLNVATGDGDMVDQLATSLRRTRRLRHLMLLAATANVVLFVVNLSLTLAR